MPFDVRKLLCIPECELVRGQQDVHLHSLVGAEFIFPDDLACSRSSYVSDDVKIGCPGCKLRLPRGNSGKRHNDKERTILVHFVKKVGQERNCLYGLHIEVSVLKRTSKFNVPFQDPFHPQGCHSRLYSINMPTN